MRLIVLTAILLIICSAKAAAGGPDLDSVVRESLENYFHAHSEAVDFQRWQYDGEILLIGKTLTVHSMVWSQSETGRWSIHSCATTVAITKPGQYRDLGTECD